VPVRNLAAFNRREAVNSIQGGTNQQITDPLRYVTVSATPETPSTTQWTFPPPKMKKAIAEILQEEGYIKNFQIVATAPGVIRVTLNYLPGKEKAIQGLRESPSPPAVYAGARSCPCPQGPGHRHCIHLQGCHDG
jgi:small subunit ribosomal protein S8